MSDERRAMFKALRDAIVDGKRDAGADADGWTAIRLNRAEAFLVCEALRLLLILPPRLVQVCSTTAHMRLEDCAQSTRLIEAAQLRAELDALTSDHEGFYLRVRWFIAQLLERIPAPELGRIIQNVASSSPEQLDAKAMVATWHHTGLYSYLAVLATLLKEGASNTREGER